MPPGVPAPFLWAGALPCASMSAHSCGKSGMVLAVVAMSCTSTPLHGQAEDGTRGGHPVVRVAAHDAGMELCGPDDQSVGCLLGVPAEPVDFGDQRREPVRLVPAQVGDAAEPGGAGGQRAECGDGGGELAGVGEVGALDFTAAGDRERSGVQGHGRPPCR